MKIRNLKKETKGVTLISLVVTIIILVIIAGISINSGANIIKNARLEEIRTNMLLIQAKAKEYVEDVDFRMGINPEQKSPEEKEDIRRQVYEQEAKLEKAEDVPENFGIADASTCYWLTPEAQKNWGLEKMELEDNEGYLIQFNETDITVEVYNTSGYEDSYSLTDIDKIQN